MWKGRLKLIQFLMAISLGSVDKLQAFHDGHHARWHADGAFHGSPNHWNTVLPPTRHAALEHEDDRQWIPLKKRGELLSSHPPSHLIRPRALKCSMIRKLSGHCPQPTNVLSTITDSHHQKKSPKPVDILKHPSHLIARHVTFVKRHSYGHQNQRYGNEDSDDSDDDGNTGDTDKKAQKDSSSGDSDNDDDDQFSGKDGGARFKSDSPSGSSSSRSNGSGGGFKPDKDDQDGDSQAQDDHDGSKPKKSGSQDDLSDKFGKSRNTKDDDSSDSNDDTDRSSSDSNSNSGSGNDHHDSWAPSSSATPASTYDNPQLTPAASESTSADSSTYTSKDSDNFSSSKTATSQKHHPMSSFNEGSKHHSSKLSPQPTAHPTYTHTQNTSNNTDDDEDTEDQCMLISKLYEELGGANWDNQAGWTNSSSQTEKGSGDCCGNFGLNCDSQDRIVSIDLASNGLVGGIPSAIFGLGSLIRLNLSLNSLVGPLPDKFEKLQNLTTVLFDSTGLSDELPISLQQLPNLISVHLSNNSFSGNVSFSAATGLTQLDLSRNKFSGSINLTSNANIEKLVLDDNFFTGQLPDLSTLPKLQIMSVSRNQFSGLPPNLAQPPPGLIRLDIQSNSLVGPFLDPINATSLQTLSMKGNTYTGSFPSSQAPPALTFCQLDHIPNSSCPPTKVLNQDNSLAKKCQLVCGKRGGVPNIGRETPKKASDANPHTVSSSSHSLVIPNINHFIILIVCTVWYN